MFSQVIPGVMSSIELEEFIKIPLIQNVRVAVKSHPRDKKTWLRLGGSAVNAFNRCRQYAGLQDNHGKQIYHSSLIEFGSIVFFFESVGFEVDAISGPTSFTLKFDGDEISGSTIQSRCDLLEYINDRMDSETSEMAHRIAAEMLKEYSKSENA